MRAGVIPRLGAECFSSPTWGFAATGRRLPLPRPPRPCGTGARIVSEPIPAKRRRSGDLTVNQRATLAPRTGWGKTGGVRTNLRPGAISMHKRFTLIASLAALVAIAVPASAAFAGETVTGPDGNTQSIEAFVAPKALYKKTASPAALNVEVK